MRFSLIIFLHDTHELDYKSQAYGYDLWFVSTSLLRTYFKNHVCNLWFLNDNEHTKYTSSNKDFKRCGIGA